MPTAAPCMNIPVRESSSPDGLVTSYCNGYKRVSLSETSMAVDPDYMFGETMKHLQPDYSEELLSDSADLNLATCTMPPIMAPTVEENESVAMAACINTHSFQPKGRLYNGLYVYDRKEIEMKTQEKLWEPIIWNKGSKYDEIMGNTFNYAREEISREYAVSADYLVGQFSNLGEAAKNAGASLKKMSHKFQLYQEEAWSGIRDYYSARRYDEPVGQRTRPAPLRRLSLRVAEGPEETARGLLFRMIGPGAFRAYLKNGFVSYKADSGRIYQIYPGMDMCRVWKNGEPVEKLCLIFQDPGLPPTDAVIMRLLMLDNNEQEFCRMAIKHSFNPPRDRYTDSVVETGRIIRLAAHKKKLKIIQVA